MLHQSIRYLSAVVLACAVLHGQADRNTTDGVLPYVIAPGSPRGSYVLDGFETVNVASGRLSVALPLLPVGARGDGGYTATASISLPPWNLEMELRSSPCSTGTPAYEDLDYFYWNTGSAFWWTAHRARYGPGMVVYRHVGWDEEINKPITGDALPYYRSTLSYVTFLAPGGTEYALHENRFTRAFTWNASAPGNVPLPSGGNERRVFQSIDGSGLTFEADVPLGDISEVGQYETQAVTLNITGWLRFPNGIRYRINNGQVSFIEDRNGNRTTFTYESIQEQGSNTVINTHRISNVTDSIGRVTQFEYDVFDIIDGQSVEVDRITYFGGESGSSTKKILVERKDIANALAPGHTLSTNLFPGLNGITSTVEILQQLVTRVVLPNGQKYSFGYNDYGEVARIDLPTGGRIEYIHGPGLPTSNEGVFVGGRVLGNYDTTEYVPGTQCRVRPTNRPTWQPFIYRRVLERRVYADGTTSIPEKVEKYDSGESVSSALYGVGTLSTQVRELNVSFSGHIEVREYLGNTSTPARVRHHSFHDGERPGGTNGPLDTLQKTKSLEAPGFLSEPDPFAGRELITEVGVGAGGSFSPTSVTETAYAKEDDQSARACHVQRTLHDGPGSISASTVYIYDHDLSGSPISSNQYVVAASDPGNLYGANPLRFTNQTDAYQFDWGAGPAFTPGACPTTVGPSSGYLRRTHTDYTVYSSSGMDWEFGRFDTHIPGLPSMVTTFGAGGQVAAETSFDYDTGSILSRGVVVGHPADPTHRRGNLTAVATRIDGATTATLSRQFDNLGNIVAETDAKNATTNYDYDDANYDFSPGNTYAFLSKIQAPSVNGFREETSWRVNYRSGRVLERIDADTIRTRYLYQDPLERLTGIESGITQSGGAEQVQTSYGYDDNQLFVASNSDRLSLGDGEHHTQTCYDGLGRVIKTTSGTGQAGSQVEVVGRQYDGFGRLEAVSNPQFGSVNCTPVSSGEWTTYEYDELDRQVATVMPDGSRTDVTFALNETTTADPAGKSTKRVADALGRLTAVVEDPSNLAYTTSYVYDGADRLTDVYSHGNTQHRHFVYDLAGRLLLADNPESGQINYAYDLNGNLIERTDARGVSQCFGNFSGPGGACDGAGYDALNRPTTVSYSIPQGEATATPDVGYFYGEAGPPGETCYNVGKLTRVSTAGLSESSNTCHDALGRVTRSLQTDLQTGSIYQFDYTYNLDATLQTTTYPHTDPVAQTGTRRIVAYEYDGKGRPQKAGLLGVGATDYLQGATYAAHGGTLSMTLGNGVVETTQYNNRLQPCSMSAAGLLTLSFAYGAGDTGCSATNSDNNGNILKQTITPTVAGVGAFSQNYAYDELNRLSSVQETTTSWQRTYHYDAFGNRAMRGAVPTPAAAPLCAEDDASLGCSTQAGTTADKPGFVPASNRLTADWASYDLAGNLLWYKDPLISGARQWSAAYDANNKQSLFCAGVSGPCTGTTATYNYDGQGNRVRKTTAAGSTTYVYDAFGKLAAEYSTAPPTSAVGRFFRTTDHLGSTRLVTDDQGGCKVWQDFYPFGERILGGASTGRQGWTCYGGADTDAFEQEFSAKERDDESGLDYFLARYYAGSLGRFTSVDPGGAGASVVNPQTWNGYAYVNNNPMVFVDPNGESATFFGALGGGIIGGAVAAYRGEDITTGVLKGVIAGGLAGSVIDTGGASLAVFAASGAVGGGVGVALDQALAGQEIDPGGVLVGAAFGSALGAGGAKLAPAIGAGIRSLGFRTGLSETATLAQSSFSETFSPSGQKALQRATGLGIKTIDDLAGAIKSGAVSADDITVNVVVRNGKTFILNTRTTVALERAGVERSSIKVVDQTGNKTFEELLNGQLFRNGLSDDGAFLTNPR